MDTYMIAICRCSGKYQGFIVEAASKAEAKEKAKKAAESFGSGIYDFNDVKVVKKKKKMKG